MFGAMPRVFEAFVAERDALERAAKADDRPAAAVVRRFRRRTAIAGEKFRRIQINRIVEAVRGRIDIHHLDIFADRPWLQVLFPGVDTVVWFTATDATVFAMLGWSA
jgi:hypothetical protein